MNVHKNVIEFNKSFKFYAACTVYLTILSRNARNCQDSFSVVNNMCTRVSQLSGGCKKGSSRQQRESTNDSIDATLSTGTQEGLVKTAYTAKGPWCVQQWLV